MATSSNSGGERLRLADLKILVPREDAIRENKVVGFNSDDERGRPFNLLRTSFSKRLDEDGLRLIGLTSAAPAAGKSFLSINLANSLARVTDDPVFLVDLDMRRASLAEGFGCVPEFGIESFLSGKVNALRNIGFRIDGTNLGFFPTLRQGRNTAELLASRRFQEMISVFRNGFENSIILFDLPPVFANDDAMIILQQLDAYMMVVNSGETTRDQVKEMLAMLRPTICLGSILNRYRGGLTDDYGYGSSKYGAYYS